jgi:hypothetical protein
MDFPDLDSLDTDAYQPSAAALGDGDIMKTSKTVVLWGSEDILIRSVESFLSSSKEWRVVSLSNKKDVSALIQAVESTEVGLP